MTKWTLLLAVTSPSIELFWADLQLHLIIGCGLSAILCLGQWSFINMLLLLCEVRPMSAYTLHASQVSLREVINTHHCVVIDNRRQYCVHTHCNVGIPVWSRQVLTQIKGYVSICHRVVITCVYTGAAVWYCVTFAACLPECMYVYVLIWTGMFAIPCSRIVCVWTHVLTGYVYIMWNGQGEIEFEYYKNVNKLQHLQTFSYCVCTWTVECHGANAVLSSTAWQLA